MKKVYIIHGLMGWPNLGWKSWLMNELAKQDVYACSLPMPETNDPKKEDWVNEIKRIAERGDTENTILVGHSLGVPAVLRFLEENNFKFLGIVLVSGAVKQIPQAKEKIQSKIAGFITDDFNWSKIKENVKYISVIHGNDDDLVPVEHAEIISENLNIKPQILDHGGHLSDDCHELPEVLQAIVEMV